MSPQPDLAAPARWHDSLRKSRERRAAAWRRRRRRLRGRGLAVALIASMLLVTGVALAATSSSGTSGATLQTGASGSAVKQLQRKLHVTVTGYYGSQTKHAVKRWQAAHGLTADGVAGPATLRALGIDASKASYNNGGASPGSTSSGSSGSGSSAKLPPELRKIAQCESGGDPTAVSSSGRYRGKYQFDKATWRAAGGSGDPAAAPESTQDRIALKLYRERGTAPWPNCA
jgi:peptidoglycan hydrolase-like protein with peptidoglycan-binding domain